MATPFARLEGKYEILEKIREGGMGSVYKVRHRLLEEVRVVKVMRPHLAEDEVLRQRFLREAKVAIKLRHPNIAQIYDFTMDDSGYAYLVMEFIDGLNLQEVIKVLGRPGLGLVLEISRQSLEALAYLHRKGIVHRDVSPDNLLVTRDDEGALRVKLIDLGIAKVRGGDDNLTSAGTFLGKVRYSSPEHFKTQDGTEVSAASDLYSFGVVLYELLTGTYPIKGTSVASLISGHLMHPPLDFAESDPDGLVPDELRAIVLTSLEKKPEDRFDSAARFIRALEPWIERHSLSDDQFQAIFDIPTVTTHKIRTVKPGSTQSRIDRSFGLETTPPPDDSSNVDDEFDTSGTVETPDAASVRKGSGDESQRAQVHALLVGASKLAEAKHFEEARLQIASILEIDAANPEARALLRTVEEADVELKMRRQDVVENVRILIRAESFDQASKQLARAIKEMGTAEIFDQTRDEIARRRAAFDARIEKLEKIGEKALALMADEKFEQAIPLLREGLDIEPGNRALISRLEEAEKGFEAALEARRRQKEIEVTATAVAKHLEVRDADQAGHALALATKLYGTEPIFTELAARLEELRAELRREKVEELWEQARREIETSNFTAALGRLEEAERELPEAKETEELFAAANEGLRLEKEARRRDQAIDEAALRAERLLAAGRIQTARDTVEAAVVEHGEFDQASTLRQRIEDEAASEERLVIEATALIEKALAAADGDASADAGDLLDEARALAPDHPVIAELVGETEVELRRRIEAHRRQATFANVIQSVQHQLDEGNLDEARRELMVARRLYGANDALDELGALIDAREREQRRHEVVRLVKSARKKKATLEQAIADLEAALSIDPNCEDALRLLEEKRGEERRAEESRIADECSSQLAEVDALIASGETRKALEALEALIREFGDFRAALSLRDRLQKLL